MGPILFKIFQSGFFRVINDINFASYANDNTIYCLGKNINSVNLSVVLDKVRLLGKGFDKKKTKIDREGGVMVTRTLACSFFEKRKFLPIMKSLIVIFDLGVVTSSYAQSESGQGLLACHSTKFC